MKCNRIYLNALFHIIYMCVYKCREKNDTRFRCRFNGFESKDDARFLSSVQKHFHVCWGHKNHLERRYTHSPPRTHTHSHKLTNNNNGYGNINTIREKKWTILLVKFNVNCSFTHYHWFTIALSQLPTRLMMMPLPLSSSFFFSSFICTRWKRSSNCIIQLKVLCSSSNKPALFFFFSRFFFI